MTTPDGGWPTPDGGGLISVGGAAGTLGGTNPLQGSLDSLNRSINSLTSAIQNMKSSTGGQGFGGTIQQQPTQASFTRMLNPFGRPQQPGMGGGGPGGAGNVSAPSTFSGIGTGGVAGSMMGRIASFGSGMMQNQLAMNAYGMNSQMNVTTPVSQLTGGSVTFRQAYGVNNNSLSALSTGPIDATVGAQMMQYIAGGAVINSTSLGRAGYGATAAFGLSNPTLTLGQSAGLAQQLYSPQTAQALMMTGMGMSRQMGSGQPYTSAAIAKSLITQGFTNGGRGFVSPTELSKGLGMGGRFNVSLGAAGINPTAASPFLTMYNQLFRSGYNVNQAQALVTAASQAGSGQKAALQQLQAANVKTSDIQRLKNVNAQSTGQQSNMAAGFNSGLETATSLLGRFNQVLTNLTNGPLGKLVGGAGGFLGSSGGNALGGVTGGLVNGLILKKVLSGFGSTSFSGGASGAAWGTADVTGAASLPEVAGAGGAGIAGILAAAAPVAAAAAMAVGLRLLSDQASKSGAAKAVAGTSAAQNNPLGGPLTAGIVGWLAKETSGLFGSNAGKKNGYSAGSRFGMPNVGGGAGAPPGNQGGRQGGKKGGQQAGGIARQAVGAVHAAESQVGVPYVWGGENPGVGFDCSGLVQWAYDQSGVHLPRTSGQQWSALRKRAIRTDQVQEGDLVFMAGSDGTPGNPGHVGMMISRDHLIQAPYTGADVQVIPYNPGDWQHAARPSGSMVGTSGPSGGFGGGGSVSGGAAMMLGGLVGNMGMGGSGIGFSESAVISNSGEMAALGGGGLTGGASSALGGGGGGNGAGRRSIKSTGGSAGSFAGNQRMMKQLAAKYGWASGAMWTALNNVVMRESGYNNTAQNPHSTAYGIGQFLDSTWAGYGAKTSNANLQEKYMLEYIKNRYSNPENAWSHEQRIGWYGAGGTGSGLALVGDRGPELVNLGQGGSVMSSSKTMDLLKGISAQVSQVPWSTLNNTGSASGTPPQINLNINRGAINVHMPAGSGSSDASNSGRVVAQAIVDHLTSQQMLRTIAKGMKM